jgi:predicted ATPase
MGQTLFWLGQFTQARTHLEQVVALYDPQQHHALAFQYGEDPRVACLSFLAHVLWYLGYPDQALARIHEAVSLGQEQSHPFSLAHALAFKAWVHHYRREVRVTQEWAEAAMTLSSEQRFAFFLSQQTILRGWALAEQGQGEAGIEQMRQGLAAYLATGAETEWPYLLSFLAETYEKAGQTEEGLRVLGEALTAAHKHELHLWEAELYRLKGVLLLRQAVPDGQGAESAWRQSLDVAHRQEAKALELRAAVSLTRLWQRQGKRDEARELLAPIYGWFTEGFDTADLQEAKALLEELAG